ncbi:MAG: metabolite traffic protein EboE [Candidatus Rokuibacteriota bacterium]
MKLAAPGQPHLTYCTNIHAGETWAEVRANLERYVLAVRGQVAPDRPFGVGLRLSAEAADTLARPDELAAFRDFLARHRLYVFTINGFPYGVFHGRRVKEDVYLPDWLDDARLRYTDRLATLLADLLPAEPGLEGSVSTVPGAYKPRVRDTGDAARMAARMLRHAATLHGLHERTGKLVTLALEPEPCCHMETVAETIRFFEAHLFAADAVAGFARQTGLPPGAAEAALRRHLTVCFDACHMAVEFEEPHAALRALRSAGIRVGKIQISAGLRVRVDPRDGGLRSALEPFAEGVYLHQVVERRDGGLTRFADLPDALATLDRGGEEVREWRIHFHVPLFREDLGRFTSTQGYLVQVLDLLRVEAHSPHLEVETYTWDVLPEEHRREDIVVAVARELRWVLDGLAGLPPGGEA